MLNLKNFNADEFLMKMVKLIPAEIVAFYAAAQTFIPSTFSAQLVLAILSFVMVPLYLIFALSVKNYKQIAVTSIAMIVWIFTLGGPFIFIEGYSPWMAGIALYLFTFIPPMFFGSGKEEMATATKSATKNKILVVKSWREI